MRPIPKTLLIHEAIRKIPNSENEWGEKSCSLENLSRVRIEPCSQKDFATSKSSYEHTGIMFYDVVNSAGAGIEFLVGQEIVFGDITYKINSVRKMFDGLRLHHYEIELAEGVVTSA